MVSARHINVEQGSPEWIEARVGSLGASQIHEAVARTKSGWGASRSNLMATLICEKLTGLPQETYQSNAMLWGLEQEPQAKLFYELMTDEVIEPCGLFYHPNIEGTHASPDGLLGSQGVFECKCPNSATHIDYLLTQKIPDKYIKQMMWQMACTDREYAIFASFDPRMPPELQFFKKRIERDIELIASLETDIKDFLKELDNKILALKAIC